MTEAELRASGWEGGYDFISQQDSERKRMLSLCACSRLFWGEVRLECNRQALDASERYADGRLSLLELRQAWNNVRFEPVTYCEWMIRAAGPAASQDAVLFDPQTDEDYAALEKYDTDRERKGGWRANEPALLNILLDVFGHLFRPTATSPEVADPSWITSSVLALAEGIYADRTFDRMPVLADALEDAGCDHADILAHCRGDGPHVRGCWVVDLILQKA